MKRRSFYKFQSDPYFGVLKKNICDEKSNKWTEFRVIYINMSVFLFTVSCLLRAGWDYGILLDMCNKWWAFLASKALSAGLNIITMQCLTHNFDINSIYMD